MNWPPDPPLYLCHNDAAENLIPPICRLDRPDVPSCKLFVPLNGIAGAGRMDSRKPRIEELFLEEPEHFIDVKTAAFLLRRRPSTVYNMVQEGRLDSVRVGGLIFIYKPSVVRCIRAIAAN